MINALFAVMFIRSHSFLNGASPPDPGGRVDSMLLDGQLLDSLGDLAGLGGLTPPMQVSLPCTLGLSAVSVS